MPRAAYVHVPFCARRCGYCDFPLVAGRDDLTEDYLRAIEVELRRLCSPREVDTLFFGGGTPTHLAAEALGRLLALAADWFPLAGDAEFSVEANPLDVTAEKADLLKRHGVTRVSRGQSLNDEKLARLERDHTAADVQRALGRLRGSVGSLSVDLIFAAPEESLDDWRRDLDAAVALPPDHISTYGLTFERGTTFFNRRNRGELTEVDEPTQRSMYLAAIDRLAAAGLEHYEVSNFARPGHRCQHNEAYWRGDECFAVGPGASRYVDGVRETNHRSVTTYLSRVLAGDSPVVESERLDAEDRSRELLFLTLRRVQGVQIQWFIDRTGYDPQWLLAEALDKFAGMNLLEVTDTNVRLTRDGLLVSDAIWPTVLRR